VGPYSKKPVPPWPCPICSEGLDGKGSVMTLLSHWESHVEQIPPWHGEASGQYTWRCSCGPSDMKWPHTMGAGAGLGLHMNKRHGLRMS